jgi:cell wall-associated NlpC family hydrolase
VQRRLTAVRSRLARQQRAVGAMQTAMGRIAVATYKSGGVDVTMQLLLSDEPEVFLQQASALDQLTRRQGTALRKMTVARQQLAQDRRELAQERAKAAALQQAIGTEQRSIRGSLQRSQALLSSLGAEERARLQAQRRAAVERARAARGSAPASRSERDGDSGGSAVSDGPKPGDGGSQGGRSGGADSGRGDGGGGAGDGGGGGSGRAATAVRVAYAQLGDPYRWGAGGPGAFDCSGLTSFAWRAAGVSLPHSSAAQYGSGRRVSRSDLRPGDLVFFYSPISHVGIYVGGGKMIDAPYPGSSVKITSISSMPYVGAVRP